ncbi:MAG: Rpn family recombination-promoting nuclease/putative transposase, partial [Azoarcus sp.]|nr:Rpn family recombination-promoting nuclease/putative transposase [Azoarcus sp.]
SLRTTHGNGFIYCLIEHQSTPDPMMAFRLMQYCLRVMRAHLNRESKKNTGSKKLPLVIPLLFYHGQSSPYPYSTHWFDCFDDPDLARDVYSSPFPLVDVTAIPDDKILTHKRVALLELVQKHIRQRDMMELLEQCAYLLRLHMLPDEHLEAFLHYVLQAGNTGDPRNFIEQLARRLPDYEEKTMTIAEELKRMGREEGRMEGRMEGWEEGRSEGLEKGRRSASLEIARAMLACGVDTEIVLKTTGLSREDLAQMRPPASGIGF